MGPYGPIILLWAHTEPKSGVTAKHFLKPSPEKYFLSDFSVFTCLLLILLILCPLMFMNMAFIGLIWDCGLGILVWNFGWDIWFGTLVWN